MQLQEVVLGAALLAFGVLAGYFVRRYLATREAQSIEQSTRKKLEEVDSEAKRIVEEAKNKATSILAESKNIKIITPDGNNSIFNIINITEQKEFVLLQVTEGASTDSSGSSYNIAQYTKALNYPQFYNDNPLTSSYTAHNLAWSPILMGQPNSTATISICSSFFFVFFFILPHLIVFVIIMTYFYS